MHNETMPAEKAHPAIAPLLKPHRLTPMEYRAKWLKAGVRVLKSTEKHLRAWPNFWCEPRSTQIAVTDAVQSCRYRRSLLQAELEGLKY